jgi:hypothetical protein
MNDLQETARNGKNGERTRNSVLRQLATLHNFARSGSTSMAAIRLATKSSSSSSALPIASRNSFTVVCQKPPKRICGK